jgi:hypothetical protein
MRPALTLLLLLLAPASALAQQDPSFCQKAAEALQTQRNAAADTAASYAAQLALAQDQLKRLQAELDEIKKKAAAVTTPEPQK